MPRKKKTETNDNQDSMKNIYDYLKDSGKSKESFIFNSPQEAYEWGLKVRENVKKEKFGSVIDVDISSTVVRISFVDDIS